MTTEPHHEAGDGLFRFIDIRASAEQRVAIYKAALDSSYISTEYVALLVLAGLIALFGLLENSTAVIIGAMLISPLMNPILSAALALLLGDGNLGKRTATVLALSISGVIGVVWLVASLTPLKQATPEILARTTPNLLDLFIAFLSGLAGTLALRGGSVGATILPGVAIAVAVIPPLSVVGYGLSTHQGSIAAGGFLLFITNLVSIIISALVVFRLFGFRARRQAEQGRWKVKYRVSVSVLVLFLLSIPLFLTLRTAAIDLSARSEVQRELRRAFQKNNSSVSDLNVSRSKNGLQITAILRTTQYVNADAIHSVENVLQSKFGPETKLLIDQILVTQGGVTEPRASPAKNPILGGVVHPVEEKAAFDFRASSADLLESVQRELDSVLAGTAIRRDGVPEIHLVPDGSSVVNVQLVSPQPLPGQTISVLASQLGTRLGLPVQLHGQIELQGPSLQLRLASETPDPGLTADDREAIGNVIQQVQENNLHLQITYPSEQTPSENGKVPRIISDIQHLLSRSGLKPSQWGISAESPTASGGATSVKAGRLEQNAPAIVSGPFRCELQSFQEF